MHLPITGVPLPVRMTFEKPLTNEQLLCFSEGNEVVWIEREANGALYATAIHDLRSGGWCAEVNGELGRWAEADGRGKVLGATGYLLPDGSMRGAPVSWVLKERLQSVVKADRDQFVPFAPDFIMEIPSAFDDAEYMRRKMDLWVDNGVKVAWLIEGSLRRVTVYRLGEEPETLVNPVSVQGTGPVRGFELVMQRVWG